MKKALFAGLLFVVLVLFLLLLHGLATSDRRAEFINMTSDLLEAHVEFQHDGSFTNHFRYTDISYCTNQFVVAGTTYQCEFTAERDQFGNFGVLAITTNQVFVWIDKKRGVLPLFSRGTPVKFPPGL
jgi:hypothetical protein